MTGISLGSNPITGVYVGSTLATGVYLGSTKIWPAPKVTFVGACTSASSAVAVSSLNLGLPAAAVAGDVVLANIISNADQTGGGAYSTSGPAGSIKFVADTPFEHATLHPGVDSAYAVRLSATDIANGYVTFGFQNFSQAAIRGVVFRGVSQTMFDAAAGVAASSAAVANPFAFSAPGITTRTNGCTLVAMGAVDATVTTAITAPTGYTVGDLGNDINILQQFAYQQQASAGATGDVSMTFGPDSTISPQGWFAWLVALRPIAPAITLSATFPSSLHVGDTGSFDITATLIDGATGSPTITGSSLPDGMSIGTTTDNGDGTFTATVNYDLTTEQDITASFGTTGGSVAATALVHEFDVTVPATLVQPIVLNNVQASSVTATLRDAPQAGHRLIAWLLHNSAATVTPPAGFTQISYSTVGSALGIHVWAKTSDGTEQSVTTSIDTVRFLGFGYAEWTGSGPDATVTTGGSSASGTSNAFGPSSPTVTDSVPFALFGINGQPANQAVSSGWTGTFIAAPLAFETPAAAVMDSVPTGAVSGTISYTNATGVFAWAIVWMKP